MFVAVSFTIAIIALGELAAWVLLRRIRKNDVEFPEISERLLAKFVSWDPFLGWCNQPDTEKLDRSDRKKGGEGGEGLATFRTDALGSRTPYEPVRRTATIACYGDSYCMSRDVEDHETWPWHLGRLLEARVSNYGVGNYGLDQAVLRLERDYDKDPADIVVLSVVSISMARAVSVYRHYLEPGNILAIKPRFSISSDERLELIPYPCANKLDLHDLSRFKEYFRKHDAHYRRWKHTRSRFPHVYRLAMRENRLQAVLWFANRLGGLLPKSDSVKPALQERLQAHRIEYELSFWNKEEKLFLAMMRRFTEFAERKNFIPIFMLQHQRRSVMHAVGKPGAPIWTKALNQAEESNSKLSVVDTLSWIESIDDRDSLYRKSHHSPHGNMLIARKLAEYLTSRAGQSFSVRDQHQKQSCGLGARDVP